MQNVPTHDTIDNIRRRSARTETSWDMAVDTAETPAKRSRAEHDRDAAMDRWDAAIEAVVAGDYPAAIEALQQAARLAAEWGDDSEERAALEMVEALAAGHVACECGEWSGERCEWSGPESETVVVEWMPEHLRASHESAGNSGVYPHNGARLIRCERSCAARIVSDAPEWARIVES